MTMDVAGYPITLDHDPAAPQNRLTVFFRILIAIPALIVAAIIQLVAFVVTVIAWFAILITGSYPAGLFGFVAGALRWNARVNAYLYLLTDRYPPFSLNDDPAWPIRVSVAESIEGRNRLTVFFRIIMGIPHYIILGILNYVVQILLFVCWLIALFAGRLPDGLHNFLAGYLRWQTRFNGYMALLTDRYPPFSFN